MRLLGSISTLKKPPRILLLVHYSNQFHDKIGPILFLACLHSFYLHAKICKPRFNARFRSDAPYYQTSFLSRNPSHTHPPGASLSSPSDGHACAFRPQLKEPLPILIPASSTVLLRGSSFYERSFCVSSCLTKGASEYASAPYQIAAAHPVLPDGSDCACLRAGRPGNCSRRDPRRTASHHQAHGRTRR